jgi:uncharacterized protein YbjT (DUF2867 family)
MILVVGATALAGNEVCQKLAQRGAKVRALVRPSSSQEKMGSVKRAACPKGAKC